MSMDPQTASAVAEDWLTQALKVLDGAPDPGDLVLLQDPLRPGDTPIYEALRGEADVIHHASTS